MMFNRRRHVDLPRIDLQGRAILQDTGPESKALVFTIGFIGGGVLLATGVVLVVTSGHSAKKEGSSHAQTTLVPMAGRDGGGLTVLGRF